MVYMVTSSSHKYTHEALAEESPSLKRLGYGRFFSRRKLPFGSYIFSDFDRLNSWQLEVAAHAYRALTAAGCRVLNDPATALQRLPLLQSLYRHGVNSFTAWPATDIHLVERFPVFLRTTSGHRGVISDLLYDENSLQLALTTAIATGFTISNLIIVEYCAEPIRDDVFRKRSIYRIADTYVAIPSVHERTWCAKYGESGLISDEEYADDVRTMDSPQFLELVKRGFEIANTEYGRMDFGVVNNKVEIYEINNNPTARRISPNMNEARYIGFKDSRKRIIDALQRLDDDLDHRDVLISMPLPQIIGKQNRFTKVTRGQFWVA